MSSPTFLPDVSSLARRLVALLVATDAYHRDNHLLRDVGTNASEVPAKAELHPWDAPSWWWREEGRPARTARDDVTP